VTRYRPCSDSKVDNRNFSRERERKTMPEDQNGGLMQSVIDHSGKIARLEVKHDQHESALEQLRADITQALADSLQGYQETVNALLARVDALEAGKASNNNSKPEKPSTPAKVEVDVRQPDAMTRLVRRGNKLYERPVKSA
jgi:hypothetical protein